MSFGGVDEAKLVSEAKKQLLPELEQMIQRIIRETLDEYTVKNTTTFERTPKP